VLGLAGPPLRHRIKIEVSASAWFHSRLMSLSGAAPARGSADPKRWIEMQLGDEPARKSAGG
jgi:hypothetical protein